MIVRGARRGKETGEETVGTAAMLRAVLQKNLRDTADYLDRPKKLVKGRGRLHEFRVQSRLASAAVILARPVISRKIADEISRKLRKLRHAAGLVRDLDVAGDILLKKVPARSDIRSRVEKQIGKARARAKRRAKDKLGRKQGRSLKRLAKKATSTRGSSQASLSTEEAVRRAVRKCLERLARATKANSANPESIHRVRRRLRTLRLVIQLSLPHCPAPVLVRSEVKLKAWQARLGDINDLFRATQLLATTRRRLTKAAARASVVKATSARLRNEHANAAARAAAEYRRDARWQELSSWAGSKSPTRS